MSTEVDKIEFEEVYLELHKFVVWLANKVSDSHKDADLMNFDDVECELNLEMWKGYRRYNHLPHDQLLAVIRKMMDNRISELRYRYFKTHRKQEIYNLSINELDDDTSFTNYGEKLVDAGSADPLQLYISNEYVLEVRIRLSDNAKRVFDAVIYGNERVNDMIRLSGIRNAYAYKNGGTLKIRVHHIADALCMDLNDVKVGWNEIRTVCNAES